MVCLAEGSKQQACLIPVPFDSIHAMSLLTGATHTQDGDSIMHTLNPSITPLIHIQTPQPSRLKNFPHITAYGLGEQLDIGRNRHNDIYISTPMPGVVMVC